VRDALATATRKSVVLESKDRLRHSRRPRRQVGTTVWDGSLRTQLERLREQLKQGPV